MAHQFDTGFALPQRRIIREAIVARLNEDLPLASLPGSTGSLYAAGIVELAAPFQHGDGDLEVMIRDAVAGRSPVIAVALGSRSFESVGMDGTTWRGAVQVHVYVISGHARGLLDRLRGGDAAADASNAADPGLETALEHVFDRLTGFVPPETYAKELRPTREDFSYVGEDVSIAELVFDLDYETNVNPRRALTQVVVDIDTTHTDSEAGALAAPTTRTELEEP